jgi:hypothetical protein
MKLVQANLDHFDEVAAMIERVKEALVAQGILQWNEHYPSRAFIREAITDGNLYVFIDDENIIGSVVLDEWQSPEWDAINWLSAESSVLVIHALTVEPRLQGGAMAQPCYAPVSSWLAKMAMDACGWMSLRATGLPEVCMNDMGISIAVRFNITPSPLVIKIMTATKKSWLELAQ